jgi:hypothetical protein
MPRKSASTLLAVFMLLAALLISPIAAPAQDEQGQPAPPPAPPSFNGTVCFPPAWGGIVPGITVERDLITLYGDGLAREDVSGAVTRYYSDADRSVTVVVEVGTDGIVDSVTLISGVVVPEGYDPDSAFISPRVDPAEGFGNYYKLRLGSTRADVKNNLGEPPSAKDMDADPDVWIYGTDYISDCYGQATMTIRFQGDKVSSVEFYNGE